MRFFFQSLFGKISLIYIILLLGLGVVLAMFAVRTYSQFYMEADQKLNRDLAKNLKEDFTPFFVDEPESGAIELTIHNLMVYNPRIEIYVLDEEGVIRSFFASPDKIKRDRVSLDPISAFMENEEEFPIMGDDPRSEFGQKPFSVAQVDIGGNTGYLYVILGGELFDSNLSMARDSRIASVALLGLALILFVTALVGLILFALTTQRFRRLSNVVKAFEGGEYGQRAPESNDEIGQLGSAFNQMAGAIETNVQELKHTDDLRRELIANVSHDLRSPLASIQGYIETIMMLEDRVDAKERKGYLEIVLKSAQMLNRLVGELFELSKLDAKQVQPNLEDFSMAELAQDVVMKFSPIAQQQEIELTAQYPQSLPVVQGDIGMIERVMSNLIKNAIQYTPAGGQVSVDIAQQNGHVLVKVEDTGPGIPADEIPKVTDRFYRIEKSRSRDSGGGGLGLAIAQRLLDLHESDLSIESEVGTGTKMSFHLNAV